MSENKVRVFRVQEYDRGLDHVHVYQEFKRYEDAKAYMRHVYGNGNIEIRAVVF